MYFLGKSSRINQRDQLKRVLVAVLLLGLALGFVYYHRDLEEDAWIHWLAKPVTLLVHPFARGFQLTRDTASSLFGHYLFLVGVAGENEELKKNNEILRTQVLLGRELENENDRLRHLLDFKKNLKGDWVGGKVIEYPPIGPYRIMAIDKGSNDGVKRRAAVISSSGLVGQVARVMPNTSQVILITDPTSAVDVRIDGTEARGLIVGKSLKLGLNRELFIGAFEYLNQSAQIAEGSSVTTSGLDGIFPGGVLVGFVHGGKKKKYDIFQEAEVIPSVDFFKLREVLIQVNQP